jgi:hypothetical protein
MRIERAHPKLGAKGWVALLWLVIPNCSSSAICNCPANGCYQCEPSSVATGEVPVGPPLPPVSSASADSPCSAEYQSFANRVLVSRRGAGTCNVHVQFVDGTSYAAQILFSKIDAPCGCILGGNASALEPTDGGDSAMLVDASEGDANNSDASDVLRTSETHEGGDLEGTDMSHHGCLPALSNVDECGVRIPAIVIGEIGPS